MSARAAPIRLLCSFAVASAAAALPAFCQPSAQQEEGFLGADGVLYDNEQSFKVMQMKPLSGNLLSNGSFERGRYWPYGWWPTDGLSTFWIEGGTDGRRCMRVFTNVDDTQWSEHERHVRATIDAVVESGRDPQELATNPLPPTPQPLPTHPPYYSTVGGIHGVHYRSEYLQCKPGAIYRFSVDCRNGGKVTAGKKDGAEVPRNEGGALPAGGTGEPRVFIKGFFDHKMKTAKGVETVRRNSYRAPMILDPCSEKWRRYARLLHPTRSTSTLDKQRLDTEYLQVQLYAYWPVGNYYFDNVRLEIVGMGDVKPPEPRQPIEAEQPAGDDKKAQPLGDEEFPIFGD
jgi:hypothetical protein